MVAELIELSRLQGAERLPNVTDVEVDTVVSEAISRHKVAADNAQIQVRTDAPSGLRVLGDETLLVTALANLVSNAIAYSPPGSPVSISRRRRGDSIEIAVTDRGIGIALEDQERVFERFFRGDKARSRPITMAASACGASREPDRRSHCPFRPIGTTTNNLSNHGAVRCGPTGPNERKS
jgi:two-component system sensor histidine kinase SenX3